MVFLLHGLQAQLPPVKDKPALQSAACPLGIPPSWVTGWHHILFVLHLLVGKIQTKQSFLILWQPLPTASPWFPTAKAEQQHCRGCNILVWSTPFLSFLGKTDWPSHSEISGKLLSVQPGWQGKASSLSSAKQGTTSNRQRGTRMLGTAALKLAPLISNQELWQQDEQKQPLRGKRRQAVLLPFQVRRVYENQPQTLCCASDVELWHLSGLFSLTDFTGAVFKTTCAVYKRKARCWEQAVSRDLRFRAMATQVGTAGEVNTNRDWETCPWAPVLKGKGRINRIIRRQWHMCSAHIAHGTCW